MFSQVSVCPGGVCHPPGQTPPPAQADTTPARHPPAQCMLGYTPFPGHAGIHNPLPSACWDTPPCPVHAGLEYGQQACGTHPPGMHSC